ncbi:esterase/lipase family protein [Gordonia shandongensis]|uniref:esterase/lipase family protein n=1 Tax=Gordonia shandongensis TaxID=376351 RepID=UPI00041B160F|nr:alpha/beta fold hydrolase [Gordonia shandongensis]
MTNLLHRHWGRPVAAVVTAGMRAGQRVSAPALWAARRIVRRLPIERVAAIGDDETQAKTKVVYDFFSGIGPELADPGGTLPGANRWGRPCHPERPNPVILVHGTGGGAQTNWGTYVPLLTDAGFSVFTLTYGAIEGSRWPISALGGMRRIEESAEEFGAFVDRVLASTGAERVDVVGHSQGTLVPAYWAKFLGGADRIDKYVSLAPLWEGTAAFSESRPVMAALGDALGIDPSAVVPCRALPQMMRGSLFLRRLNGGGGPYVPGIRYTNISTMRDELVTPYTSGQVEGGPDDSVVNIVLQAGCPRDLSDHLGICGSPRAAAMVLNALDDHREWAIPCRLVSPFFGSPLLARTGGLPQLITPFAPGLIGGHDLPAARSR